MLETAIKERAEKERLIGREEGREEGRREVALRLLAMGRSPSEVAEATGLSMEEVRDLAH